MKNAEAPRYQTFFFGLNASVTHYPVLGLRLLQCRMTYEVRPVNCHVDRPATMWPAAKNAFAFRSKDDVRQDRQPDSLKVQQAFVRCSGKSLLGGEVVCDMLHLTPFNYPPENSAPSYD